MDEDRKVEIKIWLSKREWIRQPMADVANKDTLKKLLDIAHELLEDNDRLDKEVRFWKDRSRGRGR